MPRFLLPALALLVYGVPGALVRGDEPSGWKVLSREFVFDVPPVPECHASTLAEVDGKLIVAWFAGKQEGTDDVSIWMARQQGDSWTTPKKIVEGVEPDGQRYPCWNPVLFLAGKELILFYKVGPSPARWWGMLVRSTDAGQTWSQPERLPDGILGPIKNKPVLLADGTLLCGSSTEHDGWRVHFEMSPDAGKSWTKGDSVNDGKMFGAIQPAILVLGRHKLRYLCRSKQGKILTGASEDKGKTWSPMTATDLPNPNSGIDAVTLRDGQHVLIYNHTASGRTPLNVAVSKDGLVWSPGPVLETEPGEYSYPAVIQTADGRVHVTYTWKRQKVRHLVLGR
jgi:predicted neuraminidase